MRNEVDQFIKHGLESPWCKTMHESCMLAVRICFFGTEMLQFKSSTEQQIKKQWGSKRKAIQRLINWKELTTDQQRKAATKDHVLMYVKEVQQKKARVKDHRPLKRIDKFRGWHLHGLALPSMP